MSTVASPIHESCNTAPDHSDSSPIHESCSTAPDHSDSSEVVTSDSTSGTEAPVVKPSQREGAGFACNMAPVHDDGGFRAVTGDVRRRQWEEEGQHCGSRAAQSRHWGESGDRRRLTRRPAAAGGNGQSGEKQCCEDLDGDDGGGEAGGSRKKPCRVAVIGAGGFIASWIVKLLLERGFYVRGALRRLDDEGCAHLRSLPGARERLELAQANILHPPSLVGVVEGCEGVFHTACPVPPTIADPEAQMLRPAVEGTLNVLAACAQAHVKRVVMTSSIGTVYMNPSTSPSQVLDEKCWSDESFLKDTEEWYCLAKLMAERAAWEYASSHNVDLVTICPGVTLGTMLQPRVNQSSIHILKYLDGSTQTYANLCQAYVDVEDAAEAHVLAFVTPAAKGRYLCCKWSRHRGQVVETLARMWPQYPIPTRCKSKGGPSKVPLQFCNKKVEQLGLDFMTFDQTLRNTVLSLQTKGILYKAIPAKEDMAGKKRSMEDNDTQIGRPLPLTMPTLVDIA